MKVLIHDAVFAPAAANAEDLVELVLFARRGLHRLVVLDEPSPYFDAWLTATHQTEHWRAVSGNSARAGAQNPLVHAIEVDVVGSNDTRPMAPRVDVHTAVRILRQPLRILIENGINDANFLRALASLDGRCATLKKLEEEGSLEFEHGGGLPDMCVQMAAKVRNPHDRLRRMVIFDSDALAPGRPSDKANELSSLCVRNRVGHHQLARRAAENYLPPPCIGEWGARQSEVTKRQARRWCNLTPTQRHHFHMREGLAKDEENPMQGYLDRRRDLTTGVDIFAGLADETRAVLRQGFARALRPLFDGDRPEWERWMREDGQTDEVRALFRELFSRL